MDRRGFVPVLLGVLFGTRAIEDVAKDDYVWRDDFIGRAPFARDMIALRGPYWYQLRNDGEYHCYWWSDDGSGVTRVWIDGVEVKRSSALRRQRAASEGK